MNECIKACRISFLFPSPVDHTRVKLTFKTTNQDTDYINANFIKVKTKKKQTLLSNVVKQYPGGLMYSTVHRALVLTIFLVFVQLSIQGMDGPEAYIATQGPLPNTVIDFWRMNWEYNVAVSMTVWEREMI